MTLSPRLHREVFLIAALLMLSCGTIATAQDINSYTITASKDLFTKEFNRARENPDVLHNLPGLDCAIEYLRRTPDHEIVYRRGPIQLAQNGLAPMALPAAEPSTEALESASDYFVGGMLIDPPRAGEVDNLESAASGQTHYMIRTALLPLSYKNQTLSARVVLERALVRVSGSSIEVIRSEVFSREVELDGNQPLSFSLPVWDVGDGPNTAVPDKLEETVLITLEVPRFFGFSRNAPEPFNKTTLITYAVPRTSSVKLSISVEGREVVLDKGTKEAGRYSVAWKTDNLKDGAYKATLAVEDSHGSFVPSNTLYLTRDHKASSYEPAQPTGRPMPVPEGRMTDMRMADGHLSISLESGLAYQFPVDKARGFRNMFTHLMARIGWRFNPTLELGLVAGEDAFHERPESNVDTDKISDYGGVVGYTYGFVGGYVRLAMGSSRIQPLVQTTVAFTNKATILDVGLGLRASILPGIEAYLVPSYMVHFRSDASSKLGIQYGVTVRL